MLRGLPRTPLAHTLISEWPSREDAVREALAKRPHTSESLADLFKRKPRKSVEEGLLPLVAVGRAEHEQDTDTWYAIG